MNVAWNYPHHEPAFEQGVDSEYVISASHFTNGHSVGATAFRRAGESAWIVSDVVPSHRNDSEAWRAYAGGCVEAAERAGAKSNITLFIAAKTLVDYLIRAREEGATSPPPKLGKKPQPVKAHDILCRFFEVVSAKQLTYDPVHFQPELQGETDIAGRLERARKRVGRQLPKAK